MPTSASLLPPSEKIINTVSLNTDVTDSTAMGIKTYNKHLAIAMTLNYVVGTGCFGIPYAFTESGLVLTTIFLVCGSALAFISMNYTLESLARAEGVISHQEGRPAPSKSPLHVMSYRKFDFAAVGEIFMGAYGKWIAQTAVIGYCLGALWSYASCFASSVASIYFLDSSDGCDIYSSTASTGCQTAYYVAMGCYAFIVLTLVVLNVAEQASIQRLLTYYRLLAMMTMIVTMIIKISGNGSTVINRRIQTIGAFDFSNFSKGFGPSMVALTCHFNMPDALQPLSEKKAARMVAFVALGIASVFYLTLGLLGAVAFENVNPLITLNWESYTGCGSSGWDSCSESSGVVTVIGSVTRMVVLLFPVVNVTSSYPIVGVTMGDNLFSVLPPKVKSVKKAQTLCRLLVSVPPILLAIAFKRLDMIFTISGYFGFLLILVLPCLFQIFSIKMCRKIFGYDNITAAIMTDYTTRVFSGSAATTTFLGTSVLITIVAIVTLAL